MIYQTSKNRSILESIFSSHTKNIVYKKHSFLLFCQRLGEVVRPGPGSLHLLGNNQKRKVHVKLREQVAFQGIDSTHSKT